MLKEVRGDLLTADVEALVNAVNTVGVMGKGIALQFRQAFPAEYFKDYQKACQTGALAIGKVHLFHCNSLGNPRYLINFPTKKHWRGKSYLPDITAGLHDLALKIEEYKIKSVALPPLGCGNGGLAWCDVKPLMVKILGNLAEVDFWLYAPPR